MAKRGRHRKPGERYPSGKLRRPVEPVTPAIWDRIRSNAEHLVGGRLLGTQLGRLAFHGELTSRQVAIGFQVGEIYGRYERINGLRRSVRSPSYEIGFRAVGRQGADADADEEDALRAKAAFVALQDHIPLCPAYMRRILEDLCVTDLAVGPAALDDIRMMLDYLIQVLGVSRIRSRTTGMAVAYAAVRNQRQSNRRED